MKSPATHQIFEDISKMLSRSIHDINNPFCVILGQLSIIEILLNKEDLNKEKIFHAITKMKSGADKMQDRMNGLRDFYKVAMGVEDYANWQGLEKAILYINYAFEENEVECQFPEGQTRANLQDLFIICYYLMKRYQSVDTPLVLKAEASKEHITIVAQGNITKVDSIEQNIFNDCLERLSGSFENESGKIVVQIPV